MRENIEELVGIKEIFGKKFEQIDEIGIKINRIDEDMKFKMDRIEKKFDNLKITLEKILKNSN